MSNKPAVQLDSLSLRLWLRLLGCTKRIENDIRSSLREQYGTTLPRFDVMAQLYRYPDGLRMGDISQQLLVTGGNVTGIVDQLVREGLVERITDPRDRRAFVAVLTTTGIEVFEAMAVQHREWITGLMDGLDHDEQEQLFALLSRLRDSLRVKLEEKTE